MSVFTTVSETELKQFLARYDQGELVSYEGISEGIENTNYFVTTTGGRFVLTVFEYFTPYELPWFLELMHHLVTHGVPGAAPIFDKDDCFQSPLCGKPAALVQRLEGKPCMEPNQAQCESIGRALAQVHVATKTYTEPRENTRGLAWMEQMAAKVMPQLSPDDNILLLKEIKFQKEQAGRDLLPQGVTHADLFRDNALFVGDELNGIIDYYFACTDAYMYDLAVVLNDWCRNDDDHSLDAELARAVTRAYAARRDIAGEELAALPAMLRAGALRFWLSRLNDKHSPREGEMTYIKDPDVFRDLLLHHIEQPFSL